VFEVSYKFDVSFALNRKKVFKDLHASYIVYTGISGRSYPTVLYLSSSECFSVLINALYTTHAKCTYITNEREI